MDNHQLDMLYPHAAAAREILNTVTRDLIKVEDKLMEFTAETPRAQKSQVIGEFLRLHRSMIESEEHWMKTLKEEMAAAAEAAAVKPRKRFRFWK